MISFKYMTDDWVLSYLDAICGLHFWSLFKFNMWFLSVNKKRGLGCRDDILEFELLSELGSNIVENCPFLSDPGKPGVRSMVPGFTHSLTLRGCADLTDVSLADDDTNPIPNDNANRAIQGNVAMSVAMVARFATDAPGGHNCNFGICLVLDPDPFPIFNPFWRERERTLFGRFSSYCDKSTMKKTQKYMSSLKRNTIAEILREIFQSDQVFQGVRSWKENSMNKDKLNVGDGKGMEEDPKEMDKKKLKEEETGSLKMKRKPPKELMKGGIRDRPLFSWIRILGWFFPFQVLLFQFMLSFPLSSFNWFSSFTFSCFSGGCHLVGAHRWLPGWLLLPHVRFNLPDLSDDAFHAFCSKLRSCIQVRHPLRLWRGQQGALLCEEPQQVPRPLAPAWHQDWLRQCHPQILYHCILQ